MGLWINVLVSYFAISLGRHFLSRKRRRKYVEPPWMVGDDAPKGQFERMESVMWLNRISASFLESWSKEINNVVIERVNTELEDMQHPLIGTPKILQFNVGTVPPFLRNLRAFPLTEGNEDLVLHVEMLWISTFSIEIGASPLKIPMSASLSSPTLGLKCKITLRFHETDLRVTMVKIELAEPPEIELSVALQGMELGRISNFLEDKISQVMYDSLNQLEIPLEEAQIEESPDQLGWQDFVSACSSERALTLRPFLDGILLMDSCHVNVSDFFKESRTVKLVLSVRLGSAQYMSQPMRGNSSKPFQFDDKIRLYVHELESAILHVEILQDTEHLFEKLHTPNRVAAWIPVKEIATAAWQKRQFTLRRSVAQKSGQEAYGSIRMNMAYEPLKDQDTLLRRSTTISSSALSSLQVDGFADEASVLGTWEITIVGGRDWPNVADVWPGTLIACRIECGSFKESTHRITPTSEPSWSDCIEIPVTDWDTHHEFLLSAELDEPLSDTKLIGRVRCSLSECADYLPQELWFRLQHSSKKKKSKRPPKVTWVRAWVCFRSNMKEFQASSLTFSNPKLSVEPVLLPSEPDDSELMWTISEGSQEA